MKSDPAFNSDEDAKAWAAQLVDGNDEPIWNHGLHLKNSWEKLEAELGEVSREEFYKHWREKCFAKTRGESYTPPNPNDQPLFEPFDDGVSFEDLESAA